MFLKSFFFYIFFFSQSFVFYLFILIIIITLNMLMSNLRLKFFYFIFLIFIYTIWGFLYNLDGLFLIFAVTEFTVLLMFIMTYLQSYGNFELSHKKFKNYFKLLIFYFFISFFFGNSVFFFNFYSFYSSLVINFSTDFFLLYQFLFEKACVLTIFLTLIISFFSLFFIFLYFTLKLVKQTQLNFLKSKNFLKKQSMLKQTVYKTNLYVFQN